MVENTLKDQTRLAVYWDFFNKFSTQGFTFLFSIILARLLSPNEFGIIALPLIFLAISQCFIDSGFSAALIRKPQLTEEDLNTAFYFNVVIGAVFYVILFLASPYIADYYEVPILNDLLKISALATIFSPLQSVHLAIFSRNLDYKTPAIISFTCCIFTGIVGVILAYYGYGVWALVFQGVAGHVLRLTMIWMMSSWRPRLLWSWISFRHLFGFGSKIMASGLIDVLYDNIFPAIIGKAYSMNDLGLYNRSISYAKLPYSQINGMLDGISYPVLSKFQHDEEKLRQAFLRVLRLNIFVLCPVMLCLSALAYPIIVLMLTDKWVACVPLFKVLCFPIIFWPIQTLSFSLLKVKARSDLMLLLNVGIKVLGLVVLFFVMPYGIEYVGYAFVIHIAFAIPWILYYVGKVTNISAFSILKVIYPSLLLGVAMYLLMELVISLIATLILKLIVGLLFGALFYILVSISMKFPEICDVKYMLNIGSSR